MAGFLHFIIPPRRALDPSTEGNSMELLSCTLTGHSGSVKAVELTPTCLISVDEEMTLHVRDFYSRVRDMVINLRWLFTLCFSSNYS